MESTRWSGADPSEDRIRSELRATLHTYQELGPSYEDQVINSFVDRIQPVLRSRQAVQPLGPQMMNRRQYRRQGRPHFGLLLMLAIVFGWLVLFGGGHHIRSGIMVFPGNGPSLTAPRQPQLPQQIPVQIPQQDPGSSVQ